MSGIDFFWRDQYALSLTTRESPEGQQDAFIHVRGRDTHHHLWVANPAALDTAGQRLKSEGAHVSSAESLPSEGPFARANLCWVPERGAVTVSLAAVGSSCVATAREADTLPKTRNYSDNAQLGFQDAAAVKVEFYFLEREAASAWTFGSVVNWNSTAPWAIGVRTLPEPAV